MMRGIIYATDLEREAVSLCAALEAAGVEGVTACVKLDCHSGQLPPYSQGGRHILRTYGVELTAPYRQTGEDAIRAACKIPFKPTKATTSRWQKIEHDAIFGLGQVMIARQKAVAS